MITATSATTAQTASAATTATTPTDEALLSSDFDTFLQMLTAQMNNQDPLNPMDSSDFASQLATFSSVEQQVVTNELLTGMITMLSASGLGDMAGWVGREVRTNVAAHFDGAPVSLTAAPSPLAEQSYLEVYDEFDTLVQRVELAAGTTDVLWAGVDDFGAPLPAGHYTFVVDNFVAGESIGVTSVSNYQEVTEARLDDGEIALMLDGGQQIGVEQVTGIRS